MPTGSCPGIIGKLSNPLSLPSYLSTSLPQMPQASTRSSASSGPIRGKSNCCISNCLSPTWTTARALAILIHPSHPSTLPVGWLSLVTQGITFSRTAVVGFNGLIDNAIAARTKREQPVVVDFIKALFLVDENFP